jgi:formylglycine-generating enzyme required for sulfatase activity
MAEVSDASAFPAVKYSAMLHERASGIPRAYYGWCQQLSWGDDPLEPTYRYPYKPNDGREHLDAADKIFRVLRGGAFHDDLRSVQCAYRFRNFPFDSRGDIGFRVVVLPCR